MERPAHSIRRVKVPITYSVLHLTEIDVGRVQAKGVTSSAAQIELSAFCSECHRCQFNGPTHRWRHSHPDHFHQRRLLPIRNEADVDVGVDRTQKLSLATIVMGHSSALSAIGTVKKRMIFRLILIRNANGVSH